MPCVRLPAVAGQFYPNDAHILRSTVCAHLQPAQPAQSVPKAIIVPHAGYVYSVAVAASGYARLKPAAKSIRRVVLLGPSHYVPLRGLAASSADLFETPLGKVPVDTDAVAEVLQLPQVQLLDAAHAREHSLEVQLPFLQELLAEFKLVPLVVGDASADEVAEVIELLWGGPETSIVISSDLSHFHDYQTASEMDRATSRAIEQLRFEELNGNRACGFRAISGLLRAARDHGLHAETIDLRNSGDTAGSRDRVVGYGAYVVE